ncbi:MAG: type II secretion system protein GspJ [Burkholderiales bacterium]
MGKRVGQRRFPAGQGGFTLLEVIVAVALLAVLAVLSLRGIDSVLRSRERLSAAAAELDSLTVCFTQIEEDLRRAWPVRLRLASESPIQFSPAAPEEGAPPLLLLREGAGGAAPGVIQRVSYRLRGGVLERGFAPWQAAVAEAPDGLSGAGRAPAAGNADPVGAAGMVWQPLIAGVSAVRWRGFLPAAGWMDEAAMGAMARTPPPAGQAPAVPVGLEIVLERRGSGPVRRVFGVRD